MVDCQIGNQYYTCSEVRQVILGCPQPVGISQRLTKEKAAQCGCSNGGELGQATSAWIMALQIGKCAHQWLDQKTRIGSSLADQFNFRHCELNECRKNMQQEKEQCKSVTTTGSDCNIVVLLAESLESMTSSSTVSLEWWQATSPLTRPATKNLKGLTISGLFSNSSYLPQAVEQLLNQWQWHL